MNESEVILLGDPVCYVDSIQGVDEIGVVTNSCITNFKVLWNDEINSKIEIYNRIRLARFDEVDAQCRMITGKRKDG